MQQADYQIHVFHIFHNFIKTCFLKTVFNDFWSDASRANTRTFMTSMIETFWNGFLLSIESITFWTTFVLCFAFKERITLWSIGCKTDAVLEGRNQSLLDFYIWIYSTVISDQCDRPIFFNKLLLTIFRSAVNPSNFSSEINNNKAVLRHTWSTKCCSICQ